MLAVVEAGLVEEVVEVRAKTVEVGDVTSEVESELEEVEDKEASIRGGSERGAYLKNEESTGIASAI